MEFPKLTDIHRFFCFQNKIIPTTPENDLQGRGYCLAESVAQILGKGRAVSGFFRSEMGAKAHGWVEIDGHVIDAGRWQFEGKEPYLYVGSLDSRYDEGGRQLRRRMREAFPKTKAGQAPYHMHWTPAAEKRLKDVTGATQLQELRLSQLAWIAGTDYTLLGPEIQDIYQELERVNCSAFIPPAFKEKASVQFDR